MKSYTCTVLRNGEVHSVIDVDAESAKSAAQDAVNLVNQHREEEKWQVKMAFDGSNGIVELPMMFVRSRNVMHYTIE